MAKLLKRKVDKYLSEWKASAEHKPLIIKGARQVGKTYSIDAFIRANYGNVVKINFVEQKMYKGIFDNGYEVDAIIKNISLLNSALSFIPDDTIFFFDELQECPQ